MDTLKISSSQLLSTQLEYFDITDKLRDKLNKLIKKKLDIKKQFFEATLFQLLSIWQDSYKSQISIIKDEVQLNKTELQEVDYIDERLREISDNEIHLDIPVNKVSQLKQNENKVIDGIDFLKNVNTDFPSHWKKKKK